MGLFGAKEVYDGVDYEGPHNNVTLCRLCWTNISYNVRTSFVYFGMSIAFMYKPIRIHVTIMTKVMELSVHYYHNGQQSASTQEKK